jgi:hypothetical protein
VPIRGGGRAYNIAIATVLRSFSEEKAKKEAAGEEDQRRRGCSQRLLLRILSADSLVRVSYGWLDRLFGLFAFNREQYLNQQTARGAFEALIVPL